VQRRGASDEIDKPRAGAECFREQSRKIAYALCMTPCRVIANLSRACQALHNLEL